MRASVFDALISLQRRVKRGVPSARARRACADGCTLPSRVRSVRLRALVFLPHAVSRIALVKPDKARGVENMVISMAQRGQISEPVCALRCACMFACDSWAVCVCASTRRLTPASALQVTDAQLLQMLEKVNEQMPKTGITVRVQCSHTSTRHLRLRTQACGCSRCVL
jgi:hypothetical protein